MLLTDEQKQEADRLLLTYTEYVVALKTRIPPETYAKHKQEMQAERDEWEAKLRDLSDFAMRRAPYFAPYCRGQRPPEEPAEDGGQT